MNNSCYIRTTISKIYKKIAASSKNNLFFEFMPPCRKKVMTCITCKGIFLKNKRLTSNKKYCLKNSLFVSLII